MRRIEASWSRTPDVSEGARDLESVAERIVSESADDQYPEALLQYVEALLGTQQELLTLGQRVAGTRLTFEGYRSQRRLDELAREYNDLSRRVERISESMITCRLGDVRGVDPDGVSDDDSVRDAIGSGSIPRHVGRLERTSARINQQLIAKQNAATTRMVAVASAVVAVIALASLVVAVLTAVP